jgi:hypothetical protein
MIPENVYSDSVNQTTITFSIAKSGYAMFTFGVGSGISGSAGTSGVDGTFFGTSGSSGTSGNNGTSGLNGTSGANGTSGLSGTSGSSGSSGLTGTNGTAGTSGLSGTNGTGGTSGSSGLSGTSGTGGTSGSSGLSGTAGSSGTTPAYSGTQYYIPLWSTTDSLGSSIARQDTGGTSLGIGGTPSGTYKLEVSGTVGATAYYETSDENLKDILQKNPQVDLSTLEVIQFKFKGDDQIRYGYSAQEVQKLCGDLVVGDNPLTVNYSDVHTLKILQLEQRIKELEKRLGL